MAIFVHVPEEEFGKTFKQVGWFVICPVYISDIEEEAPMIIARNGIPDFWLDFQEFAFEIYVMLRSSIDPNFEPMFPIMVTGDFRVVA